jgi:uncharacterized Zn finger protein
MRAVNESNPLHQTIAARQIPTGQMEMASNSDKIPLHRNTVIQPEDVVTLSKDRSSIMSLKKEPSAPVTSAESKALRDSFSVYA